jgi:hypothetical protein
MALAWLVAAVLGSAVILGSPHKATAQTRSSASSNSRDIAIVVGFMGGHVNSHDLRREEVRLARQLQETYSDSVHVEIFENRAKAKAHKFIRYWLENARKADISSEDNQNIPIILFGHSWGASTAISLARDLQQEGVPVMLTIQVDSVSKDGEDDSLIPGNVAEAINFYQSRGILHGCSEIKPLDPARTKVLGNVQMRYQREPEECRPYPWYNRLLFKGHIAIECDPRLWAHIEALIRMHLPLNAASDADQGRRTERAPG